MSSHAESSTAARARTTSKLPIINDPITIAYEQIKLSPFYLANSSILERVRWFKEGKANRLIEVEKDYSHPKEASLHLIARISNEKYWLTADANWKRPSEICEHLSEAKASCVLEYPGEGVLQQEFNNAVRNLKELQRKIATRNENEQKGLWKGNGGSPQISVKHILFIVCF
jgi:hypothetical protein